MNMESVRNLVAVFDKCNVGT